MATRALFVGALLVALLLPVAGSAGSSAAPSNTGQPVVSGTTAVGRILTTTNGTWSGTTPIAFVHRWLRCDASGGGPNGVTCTTIARATQRTYRIRQADLGRRIRSRVIATNAEGAASANSNATPDVVRAAGTPVPSGQTVSVNEVSLPNRLVIDQLQFAPALLSSRAPFTARFHVSDTQGHAVQGALVFVVGIPFGNTTTPPEQATGSDGWVTFTIQPTARLPLVPRGNQPFFVRARKASDRLIAGVSTRRLVNLAVRAG